MTIRELIDIQKEAISNAISETGMFFAFSDEQFQESKTPLEEGDKYISFGMGSYIPKSKVELWHKRYKEIDQNFSNAVKEHNLVENHIVYELENHESFYTMDPSDAIAVLSDYYTEEQVKEVFWKCVNSGNYN